MADISNRQLAEIISQVAETVSKSVKKEQIIANQIEKTAEQLNHDISALKQTKIEPDLSHINQFYEEKTAENIKRLNSRLNVPNLALYVWIASVLLFFSSGYFIYLSTKSKQEILSEYRAELQKNGKTIISEKENALFNEMHEWFNKNPKTRDVFVQWRNSKENK